MSDQSNSGFTRRDLMRGALAGAVATKAGGKGRDASAGGELGPGPVPLDLKVNGKLYRLSVEPRVILADALRDRLGLTGTKVVCDRGACGACTVMIDGEPVCSCLTLAIEARGKAITTIEGLAKDGRLAPIQDAFVRADALQCGFCTSGMIMSCKSLLDKNPKPSRAEIVNAVSGNLCRCGTYPHVFEAVEIAAGLKTAEARGPIFAPPITLGAARLQSDTRVDCAVSEATEEA